MSHTRSPSSVKAIGLTKNTDSFWPSSDKRPQLTRCLTDPHLTSENHPCLPAGPSVCSKNSQSKRVTLMDISNTVKIRGSLSPSGKDKPQQQPSSLGLSLNYTDESSTASVFLDKLDKKLEDKSRKRSSPDLNSPTPELTPIPTRSSIIDVNFRPPVEAKAPRIPSFWSLLKPTEIIDDTTLLTEVAIKTCKEAAEFELLSVDELDKVRETIREIQQKIASLSDEYIREKQIREGMLSMISMFAFNANGMSNATKEFEVTDARLELTSTEILTLTKRLARFQEKLWKHTAAAILLRVNQLESQLSTKKPEESPKGSSTKLLVDALEAHILLLEKSLEILKIEYLESQTELDQAWSMSERTELENRELRLQLRKIEDALTDITHEQNREYINRWTDLLKGEKVADDTDSGIVCSGETSPTKSEYSFDAVPMPIIAMTLSERLELLHRDQQVYTCYIEKLESDVAALKEEKTSPPLKSLKDMVFRQWVNDQKVEELIDGDSNVAPTIEPPFTRVPYYLEPTLRPPSYHPGIKLSERAQSSPTLYFDSTTESKMNLLMEENEFLRIMVSESQERENTWIREELVELSGDLQTSVGSLEKEIAQIMRELIAEPCYESPVPSKCDIHDEAEIDSGIESGCESGNSSPKTPIPGPLPDYEGYFDATSTLSLLNLTFDETKLANVDDECSLGFFQLPLNTEGLDRDVKVLTPEAWIH
ncbi:hypothetical protein K493DRAFT_371594 [Basidiobolus meristosporus CBS 931.73]|uniref:Up-regulated during septation protein 1 domain-containing protein n=1 Tax=Basidiobolus meristosporus CBS 931.73 TaxID=1314790 RepID=A0A1Y1YD77_9FUNG|nr:hypothetical protein K493DRAFT_371594 [Basidiobolus meristosporus CBS 931.73]|eukprot:ORX95895.1 hypothetical protein K493DRAFT_371594 [Basidiobolus meristosporus CBS 931.73]